MKENLQGEEGVNQFVERIADKVRDEIDAGRFSSVAFVMSEQFPLEPALIQMDSWLELGGNVARNTLRTAASKYGAYGVLLVCEATRHQKDESYQVVLFQLDHKLVGAKAWEARLVEGRLGELSKLPAPRGGSLCNIIPAKEKAN